MPQIYIKMLVEEKFFKRDLQKFIISLILEVLSKVEFVPKKNNNVYVRFRHPRHKEIKLVLGLHPCSRKFPHSEKIIALSRRPSAKNFQLIARITL